jgi:hypothetical protein
MKQWTIVSGRLGKDVEEKISRRGTNYISFSIATDQGDATVWYNILVFGALGATIKKYFKKGDAILINADVIGKDTLKMLDFDFPIKARSKPKDEIDVDAFIDEDDVDDFPSFDEIEEIEL